MTRRPAGAFTRTFNRRPIDDAVYDSCQQSCFREVFKKTFVMTTTNPGRGCFVAVQFRETPLGPVVMAATNKSVCFVEFSDFRILEHTYRQIRSLCALPILPVSNPVLDKLKFELAEYFEGRLKEFSVPIDIRGTPFQERVWRELLKIPYGITVSYQDVARCIGNIKAVRAVAQANGSNRIGILIPCHRVVGKNGELTGYGGGLWRKRALIELERTGKLPGG